MVLGRLVLTVASQLRYGGRESESLTRQTQSQWSSQKRPLRVPVETLENSELPLNLKGDVSIIPGSPGSSSKSV